ncbi:MAG TPA: hypothetical protein V6C81_01720 [Planktothrix sp.]|jgi:hypothetical protein
MLSNLTGIGPRPAAAFAIFVVLLSAAPAHAESQSEKNDLINLERGHNFYGFRPRKGPYDLDKQGYNAAAEQARKRGPFDSMGFRKTAAFAHSGFSLAGGGYEEGHKSNTLHGAKSESKESVLDNNLLDKPMSFEDLDSLHSRNLAAPPSLAFNALSGQRFFYDHPFKSKWKQGSSTSEFQRRHASYSLDADPHLESSKIDSVNIHLGSDNPDTFFKGNLKSAHPDNFFKYLDFETDQSVKTKNAWDLRQNDRRQQNSKRPTQSRSESSEGSESGSDAP